MNPLGFISILPRCCMSEDSSVNEGSLLTPSDGYEARLLPSSIGDGIVDFLHGRTHGEELLHALYDHILDEPVPERMREALRNGTGGTRALNS
jgi:hypothetical protein